jgi:hypothetical protein
MAFPGPKYGARARTPLGGPPHYARRVRLDLVAEMAGYMCPNRDAERFDPSTRAHTLCPPPARPSRTVRYGSE